MEWKNRLKIELPNSFFEPEVRRDFLVTPERKEIWAVELDLLVEFQRVCMKYNIKFYPISGTLLGAVRHKGFIPWDDDIDVAVFRDDFNKLEEIAKDEFVGDYFWQTERSDPGSARGHAQLRKSGTTAILFGELNKKFKFHQGIFIDIFPLDYLPKTKEREEFFCTLRKLKNEMQRYAYEEYWNDEVKLKINPYSRQFDEYCTQYNHKEHSRKIGTISFLIDKTTNHYREDVFSDVIEGEFEGIKLMLPVGYKEILLHKYGIWNEERIVSSTHGDVIFDVHRPYTYYTRD